MQALKRFLQDESGTACVDYCLLVGAITAAIIGPLREIGQRLAAIFTIIAMALRVG